MLRDALLVATGNENLLRCGPAMPGERLHRSGPVIVYNAEDRLDDMKWRRPARLTYYGITTGDLKRSITLWSGVDGPELIYMSREGERAPLRRAAGADMLAQLVREEGAVLVLVDPRRSLIQG